MAYTAGTNSTNRSVAIGVVVVMHLLLGWAFASGLARTAVEMVTGPVEVKIIKEEIKKEDLPPPPPPKQIDMPQIELPPSVVPEITLDAPPAPAQTTITTTSKPKAEPKPAAPIAANPISLKRKGRLPKPDYPATSERLGEQGVVKVTYCMRGDGSVNPDTTKLATSSGYDRLDDAVMKQALAGKFDKYFHPARAADGSGVETCTIVPFRFQIVE